MIGRFCAIATNVQMGHAEHPTDFLAVHPLFQGDPVWCDYVPDFAERNKETIRSSASRWNAEAENRLGKIVMGNDIWIGEGAFIRRGVEIGDGAIIGARSVVNRDVPPYAIVAGIPARVIRYRFPTDVIEELLRLEWWRYGLSALEGVNFTDIDLAIWRISENISSGNATLYQAPVLSVGPDSLDILHFDPEASSFS
jgi:acetyltransferase-like isoleucine patch superfamily enzyme